MGRLVRVIWTFGALLSFLGAAFGQALLPEQEPLVIALRFGLAALAGGFFTLLTIDSAEGGRTMRKFPVAILMTIAAAAASLGYYVRPESNKLFWVGFGGLLAMSIALARFFSATRGFTNPVTKEPLSDSDPHRRLLETLFQPRPSNNQPKELRKG
jgi:hypothetical protein